MMYDRTVVQDRYIVLYGMAEIEGSRRKQMDKEIVSDSDSNKPSQVVEAAQIIANC